MIKNITRKLECWHLIPKHELLGRGNKAGNTLLKMFLYSATVGQTLRRVALISDKSYTNDLPHNELLEISCRNKGGNKLMSNKVL